MKLFISWSGPRSKIVADALSKWLGNVIQAVDPWMSTDIAKGARWGPEMMKELEESKIGISCLTPENLLEPWILFEAGVLCKKGPNVCTLLIGLKTTDVGQPLSQFQHTVPEKEDIRRLLGTINDSVKTCGERALSEERLNEAFALHWPALEKVFEEAKRSATIESASIRPDREILNEILEIIRNVDRRTVPPIGLSLGEHLTRFRRGESVADYNARQAAELEYARYLAQDELAANRRISSNSRDDKPMADQPPSSSPTKLS